VTRLLNKFFNVAGVSVLGEVDGKHWSPDLPWGSDRDWKKEAIFGKMSLGLCASPWGSSVQSWLGRYDESWEGRLHKETPGHSFLKLHKTLSCPFQI